MFDSKALKGFNDEDDKRSKLGELKRKIYGWWVETPVADFYYEWTRKLITNPIFQIRRLWGWYWNVFRFDFDFDGHSIYAIIEYKLKRLEKVLINGHAIQDPKDVKALKLAIKLAGRLKDDNYWEPFYNRHEKKWGKMKDWFEPCENKNYSTWRTSRPNANTPEEKEQERKEHLATMYAEEAKTKREEKWLYGILLKYLRSWWD